jgi:hypothetical protein
LSQKLWVDVMPFFSASLPEKAEKGYYGKEVKVRLPAYPHIDLNLDLT